MANEIINAELVAKINDIVAQWNQADRAIRALELPMWTKRSARAGLENGAMLQIGKATPAAVSSEMGIDDDERIEVVGEAVFKAYRAGAVVLAMDSIR